MAVNPNEHEDDLARDPHLARVLEAAGGEAPPAALDAAILAAARRDVGARPQVVGNGDSASGAQLPVVRFKRNWYVPVSIAAVLVMSASLVMVVHQEKQDEIAQPPRQASMPAKPAAPLAPASAPAVEAPGPAPAMNYQAHQPLRDAAPAQEQPKLAEKTVVLRQEAAAPAPDVTAELRKKQRVEQRVEKAESTADSTRRDKAATAGAREPEAAGSVAAAPAAPAAVAPPAQAKLRAEPFPAQASRDAVQARARSEADQADRVRDAAQPAPLNVPPAAAPSAPRRSAPAAEVAASPMLENRGLAAAPPPAPMVAAKPMSPLAKPMARTPLWRGLEDQPPEKWLERVAEFKRDGRVAEMDELMSEFRRRFPDHPASVR